MRNSVMLKGAAALAAALALGGCETVADVVGGEEFSAALRGASVPGGGDPDGSGLAEFTIDGTTMQVCYEMNVTGIAPATMAGVHQGTAGQKGPRVIELEAPTDGDSDGCQFIGEDLADAIIANPAGYYVHVVNADYPNGAVRGQLGHADH
ncbi:MAG: CHRD domain-containing protein [Sphingomonadaceae bacterium]